MSTVHFEGRAVNTRYCLPRATTAGELLGLPGFGVAAARVAQHLGNPDPFPLRTALARLPPSTAVTVEAAGDPLDRTVLQRVLVDAAAAYPAEAWRLTALFAAGPGAAVRAHTGLLEEDDPRGPAMRYRRARAPAPRLGRGQWIANEALGQPDNATVRCLYALPDGRLAAGGDYGMALFDGRRWTGFPYPRGARREARRVEAMAVHEQRMWVASQTSWFEWDLDDAHTAHGKNLRRDAVGGHDDVRVMRVFDGRLLSGWRLGFEGGVGRPETLSLAQDPAGAIWGGTLFGEVYLVDHGEPLRVFADTKPRPVRFMAWALGWLWVAARGSLHRFDGWRWEERRGEPGALVQGPRGRLWTIRAGQVHVAHQGWPRPLELPVKRPWSLGFAHGCLWVGSVGGVLRVPLHEEG